ncbi:hypothetical protein MRB53_015753 [Persea americana]|uniref:Uncharacterized protein n=1 Tax=Persea americana TaxID=3435 RepID=A0ACC2M190_PERAE|nr:hypothetical protein MRB53_015753 [Persea americana]
MSMALTSGIFTCSLGTVTVSTPFSIAAFTSSTLAFSGNLNRLRKLSLLLSTRCHLSFFSSYSLFLSPLICRTLPYSSSTFTSSFFRPGRSALKTWASGVSFQSIWALANAEVSLPKLELVRALLLNGKPRNGSQMSSEKGSKTLDRRPKKLGMSDILSLLSFD